MLTTPSRFVYHLGYSLQCAFDAASADFIPGKSIGTNLAATRSLLAPVTRPTDLVLHDDIGLSRLGPRLPSKATCSSRTPSGSHSRPFAPTYDSLLALDHNGDGDDDHDDHDDEGEHRTWPARAEGMAGSGRQARRLEVDESEFSHHPALRLLIVRSDTDDDQWRPCPMRLTMPSSAMLGAKIKSSWRLLGESTLTVTRRADLDVYMRRSHALVNADGRARRDGGLWAYAPRDSKINPAPSKLTSPPTSA
ncbi:hypothetical protein EV121DRAFT_297720 [Schizophyllum commune]